MIVRHVADGIDVNQEADTGDDQDHDRRERVEHEADVDVKRAGGNPGTEDLSDDALGDRHRLKLEEEHD